MIGSGAKVFAWLAAATPNKEVVCKKVRLRMINYSKLY